MIETKQKRIFLKRASDSDMEKIKLFSTLNKDELVVARIRAADNLLNREYGKWGTDELSALAAMIPGVPLMLDHDWGEIDKIVGKVFSAEVRRGDASSPTAAKAMVRAGNFDANRKVMTKEGFAELIVDVYLRDFHPAVERILSGEWSEVSVGGFRYSDLWCPICDTSFSDESCPHLLPVPGLQYGDGDEIAPYYIRKGVFDVGELSLVTIPNLPAAQVLLWESVE